jgi:uncharacterized HhH-GPD family protein
MVAPETLHFTEDEEANRLLAEDPFALLVGLALDQQVTVQTAFAGPLKLKERLGTLDPTKVAHMDPRLVEDAFRQKPAVHRFPGSMATRVQELAATVADDYGGEAARIWNDAANGDELRRRLGALPGFGEMKVKTMSAILAKRFGVEAARELAPSHPTLGDVDSAESLAAYQAAKRAHKAEMRAAKAGGQ